MDYIYAAKQAAGIPYYSYKFGKQAYNMYSNLRKRKRVNVIPSNTKKAIQPAGAVIKKGRGVVIGKYKKPTFRARLQNILEPAVHFDSKWTFQAEALSGRVAAITIPLLTKDLVDPLVQELYNNATTDTTTLDPTLAPRNTTTGLQTSTAYSALIKYYTSAYQFYNSSTNTCRCRLVWYKPTYDAPATADTGNIGGTSAIPNNPLNLLMYSSTINGLGLSGGSSSGIPFTPSVGDGCTFDSASAGSNYLANYDHAGGTLVGVGTTQTALTYNSIAYLDPRLVPGSPEVRSYVSRYWRHVKSEEFMLEPGGQYNTSVYYRNRMMKRVHEDDNKTVFKDSTMIGILFIYGQIVFDDRTSNNTISTGSAQISAIRNDHCALQVDNRRRTRRLNLTQPLISIDNANQAIINPETDNKDDTYDQDL